MVRLPFAHRDDEKHLDSPREERMVTAPEDVGVIDEAQDDLHREMKPRQLSE